MSANKSYAALRFIGLLNEDAPSYADIASDEVRVEARAYCFSRACGAMTSGALKEAKKSDWACNDCGHALVWSTEIKPVKKRRSRNMSRFKKNPA